MKILILCPFVDPEHSISRRLRASGNALLFPNSAGEAFKLVQLHGASLDLAIVHREGLGDGISAGVGGDKNDEGIQLVTRIKARKELADLPMIVTSTRWGDVEFIRHQQTVNGANAYLQWPFSEAQLIQVIEEMFGSPIRFASGSQTQPSITVLTEARDRTGSQSTLTLPAPGGQKTGATQKSGILTDDVSALIEADGKTKTLSPPMPEAGIGSQNESAQDSVGGTVELKLGSAPPPFPALATQGEPIEEGTRISLINIREGSDKGEGQSDVLGQFGTSMMESVMAESSKQPQGGGIELEPPSVTELPHGLALRPKRSDPTPETLDLSNLERLEPHERLLLRTARLSENQSEGAIQGGDDTKLLDLPPGVSKAREDHTRELPTRARPAGGDLVFEAAPHDPLALGDFGSGVVLSGSGAPSRPVQAASPEARSPEAEGASDSPRNPGMSEPPGGTGGSDRSKSSEDSEDSPVDEAREQELRSELPYLFQDRMAGGARPIATDPNQILCGPIGDAVVPGGAVLSPDAETLKKYLLLREQDVSILSNQLGAAREQLIATAQVLKEERGRNLELTHTVAEQKRKLDDATRDKNLALSALQTEIDELRFQAKAKTDRVRVLESQVRDAGEDIDRMKERVRSDIRKIRVRERDLENRLEIMRKDSEALIGAREQKITELKRKVDMLEFSMDLLQDKYTREKESSGSLRERLARAAQVVRVAGGLLDSQKTTGEPGAARADRDNVEEASSDDQGGSPKGKQEAS